MPSDRLRILCFGASITAGFHSFGLAHHPYSLRLTQRLQTSLPPSTQIFIDIDALSGDRVIGGEYSTRLSRHFAHNDSSSGKGGRGQYDWIIFQGGGNDLGAGEDPTAIFAALRTLWKSCIEVGGAKVLALTVTETSDQSRRTRERYDALNQLIRSHCEEGFYVADVEKVVPYGGVGAEERRTVFDDGLHFRPAGYDRIGGAVAEMLLEILGVGDGRGKGKEKL